MEIRVHQRGGVAGLARRYEIHDDQIIVFDHGTHRRSCELDPLVRSRIDELAASILRAQVSSEGQQPRRRAKRAQRHTSPETTANVPIVDGVETSVDISTGSGSISLRPHDADAESALAWDLIELVCEASRV